MPKPLTKDELARLAQPRADELARIKRLAATREDPFLADLLESGPDDEQAHIEDVISRLYGPLRNSL